MEPPPGPCSSPPGPRPVPPPRKGSMERRPLSPLRRGGEPVGAWEAASEVSARGSKPGAPERATVTQRVLIVMQSHAGPLPGPQEPPPPECAPIPDRGASPKTSPAESAPIPARGASTPENALIPGRGASLKTSPPESAPIPGWGASLKTSPAESAPIPGWGASPPESAPIPGWGASLKTSPPESAPIPARGVSPPESAPIPGWGASLKTSPPESAPIPARGVSPPESAPIPGRGASPPESAPIPARGASLKTSPPESAPIPGWGASLKTSSAESAPIPGWGASLKISPPESAPILSWGASPPESAPIPGRGASLKTSPPESAPITKALAPLPEPIPTQSTPVQEPGPQPTPPVQEPGPQPTPPVQEPGPQPTPPVQEPGPQPTPPVQEPGPQPTPPVQEPGPQPTPPVQEPGPQPTPPVQEPGPQPTPPVQEPGESPDTLMRTSGEKSLQSTPNEKCMSITRGGPASNTGIQEWGVSLPNQLMALQYSATQDQRVSQAEGIESSGRAPPRGTGAQDCSTTHDTGTQEDAITRYVCESDITLTDGVSQSRNPQNVTENFRPSVIGAGPEDVRSSPAARPEDGKSSPATRPEDVRSSPAARPEDGKSSPAARPEDGRGSPATRPEEGRSSPATRPEEGRSSPATRPEEGRSSPATRPEEGRSSPATRPEDGKSSPATRPEEGRSSPATRPEEGRSSPATRPEDGKSSPATRPEEGRSSPATRPEEGRSSPATRPEDGKSTSAAQHITALSPNLITQVPQKQDGGPVVGNMTSNLPAQPNLGWSSLSPVRVPDPSSPHRNVSSKPPLPIPPRSNLYPGQPPREQESSASHETASLSSFKSKAPAPDTLSYLDSVSLMSGTMESLTLLDDASSIGSDSEINGMPYRRTDKYGFLGGNQFSGNGEPPIPVEIARQRELKWLDMFSNWEKWLTRRFQKVKLRCRKGIPSSLRAKAWQLLSNSHDLLMKNPGKFEEMERQQGDPKWLDVIEKDLHRQFPFHEMFAARGGHGQQDLYRILKAYTIYRPEEGYCQAQAPVAAVLLMHMPAEQAFWCLVQICDKYLPGYYSAGLEAIQLDGEIFFALLRRNCPMAYRHLKKFKIDPILYMTEWFMCVFSRTLPWASVLRVWDMFFCEGVKIIFRVGLVLLRHTLGSVDKLRSCQGMYETMEKLRSLPAHCMQEDILLPEVSSLPVTDAVIDRESNTQLRKWRENRGELQYRPTRRLHGARQIYEEKLRLNPSLSGSRLSLSSIRRPSPPPTPMLAVQPESVVVSEGLRPALPSPTSNKAPLGPPRDANKKGKEKQREQEKKREREEREREKRREKEEREERRKEKEREKQKEKEEKRVQKESKQKKERKFSFRRKESSPAADPPQNSGPGDSSGGNDTYF